MIVDQYGNPIKLATLKTPQATPTPYGARRVVQHTSTSGLDPLKAARILRQAEEGDAAAFLGIAEEMEEKYLHYGAQLATRKRAVSGITPQVLAASDEARDIEIAEFVRSQALVIHDATRHLMDAIGKGYSVCEILWDITGAKWAPRELLWRDPRWFVFDKADGRTLLLRNDYGTEALLPGHYVIHMASDKSGLPIRGGLARGAIWAFLFHNFSIRDWVTFIEQFGKPLRLGRYDSQAVTPADLDVLFEAVRSLGTDAAALLPRSMEIEFPEVSNARGENGLWHALLEYLDRQVSKLVLGQTLTADTGESGGGSYALGTVHADVRRDILEADAKQLAATINRDLIRPLVDINFAGVTRYPEYALPVAEPEDLTAKAAVVEKAVNMGYPVPMQWFSETFGIPLPEGNEDVLKSGGAPQSDWTKAINAAHDRAFRIATHARGTAGAPERSVDRLIEDTEPDLADWLGRIKAMLDAAGSLEELRELLLAAWPQLNASELEEKIATALDALALHGMDEVRG
jgi:phage gp29-like protein